MVQDFRARDYRMMARDKLRGHWGVAVLVAFLAGLLGAAGSSAVTSVVDVVVDLQDLFAQTGSVMINGVAVDVVLTALLGILAPIASAISLVYLLIGGAVELGWCCFNLRLCRNEPVQVEDLFSRFSIFMKALGLRLFTALFVFLWSLLFVVPGIIAGYRYAMAVYLMADHPEMGIREAVDASKQMMDGKKAALFCLNLSFIGWSFLCVFTLGIGALWLNPYMAAANAAFYLNASGEGIRK